VIRVNAVRGLGRWATRGRTLALLLGLLGCGPPPASHGLVAVADSLGVSLNDPACATPRPDGTRQCRRIVADGVVSLTELSAGHYRVQRFWSFPEESSWRRVRDSLEIAFAAASAVPFSCGALSQPLPSYAISRSAWYRSPYVAVLVVAHRPGPHGGYSISLDLVEPEEVPCFQLPD
jgi:hypothetical protein